MNNDRIIKREEYADYLFNLFMRAFEKGPFDTICNLLRVTGIQDAKWDPFEESLLAFKDYNWLLKKAKRSPTKYGQWRIGLLMYCQAIEMTAPHEMLANCLRCLHGKKYHIKPLGHLGRVDKKKSFSWFPASANKKFNYLKEMANACGENKLSEYIDSFFLNDVRNAFSHSDYVLTDKYFRWTENGLAQQIGLKKIDTLITNTQEFYSAFWFCHNQLLKNFSKLRKYHKWPQYEVLEILNNGKELYGFNMHFSNGNKAFFTRTPSGVDSVNLTIEKDGSINFFVGLIDALEPVWKINGKPVTDWEDINKVSGRSPRISKLGELCKKIFVSKTSRVEGGTRTLKK